MRAVITYFAFDEKGFNNREACIEYENKAYMLMRSIEKKYSFYDKNMKEITAPLASPKVEDWLTWLDDAYFYCTYIRKMGSLTEDEAKIIRENIGAYICNEEFNCAVGLFEYDSYTMKWVKVDE